MNGMDYFVWFMIIITIVCTGLTFQAMGRKS